MKASGRNFTIGNTHWFQVDTVEPIGCHRSSDPSTDPRMEGRPYPGADAASCPTEDWCPFNYFQMTADTEPEPGSWYANLQTVVPFTGVAGAAPLSRPVHTRLGLCGARS